MFENGEIFRKSKIERTDSCDIEVIESGLGKKSRNLFKEMEVENISKDVSYNYFYIIKETNLSISGFQFHEKGDHSQERGRRKRK